MPSCKRLNILIEGGGNVLFILLFFCFYTLNITGFKMGNFNLCCSCFKDEPIDFVFWLMYLVAVIATLFSPQIGRWALFGIFVLFHVVQVIFTYRFWIFKDEDKIASYNEYFSSYHHIFKEKDDVLVPDTFHLILFIGFFISLIHISFIIASDGF